MAQPETSVKFHPDMLKDKIADKSALVGVVGLGYVGLPLIQAFVSSGFHTLGIDVDPKKIEVLSAGESYIGHIKSEWIAECVKNETFQVTADLSRLSEPDVIMICVPTPLSDTRDPDLSYVEATARSVMKELRPGQLIILESTTYPGTTKDVMVPILEESGLIAGKDFFVAYSPEREDPGNIDYAAAKIPKVVGGICKTSLELAQALYDHAIVEVIPVSSAEVAEACKILENTYRAVNIALVNELKILFDQIDIDVWEVIDAAKTKPFGFQAFYPGPGLGGHCIPIDPFYLTWLARKHGLNTRFIELAGEVNTQMPQYVIDNVMRALNQHSKSVRGSKICLLGLAYKKNVDDCRESPSFELLELLQEQGAELSYSDPYIPQMKHKRKYDFSGMKSQELTKNFLQSQDCILISTDHDDFDYNFIVQNSKLVIDTRNATKDVTENRDRIMKT